MVPASKLLGDFSVAFLSEEPRANGSSGEVPNDRRTHSSRRPTRRRTRSSSPTTTRRRDTLPALLADRGFHTVQAASGEEAIEIVRVEPIHLVVFDMHMPRMTGLEALQHVRLINALLPAILVTADANRGVIRQAFQAHVYSVIPKPVNKNIVLHTLARALRQVYGDAAGEPPDDPEDPDRDPNTETDAMKVVPLNDKIVVERLEAEDKTAGGIILPDTAKEKPKQGKVLASARASRWRTASGPRSR